MTTIAATALAMADDDSLGRLRLTTRLTIAFLLDTIAIVRGQGNVIDTLLISAIIQANVAEITAHADLQVAYAARDEMPTDEMRRPVSINALAASLQLPFETVRRRVNAMVRDGHCRAIEGGVIVPTEVLNQPGYYSQAFRSYERLRAFYYKLRDLGLLRDLPPSSVDLADGVFPVRTATRLVGAYVLRIVETLGSMGPLVDAIILLEVFRSNVEHLPNDMRGGEGFNPQDMVDDRHRRPISAGAVARRVGMPVETVRRHIAGLLDRGVCTRVVGGLIVPATALANPALPMAAAANASNLNRLFAALARLGVLDVWDTLPAPDPAVFGLGR